MFSSHPMSKVRQSKKVRSPEVSAVKHATPPPAVANNNGGATAAPESMVEEKIRELLRLAKDQGHLTYNDIHELLGNGTSAPEDLDEILTRLRSLEIDVIDP